MCSLHPVSEHDDEVYGEILAAKDVEVFVKLFAVVVVVGDSLYIIIIFIIGGSEE